MRFRLRTLFILTALLCAVLATGKYWSISTHVDEVGGDWIPGVTSLIPINKYDLRLNGEEFGVMSGELFCIFGYDISNTKRFSGYRWRTVELNCLLKRDCLAPPAPDSDLCETVKAFSEQDRATISVRTVFGWSHFEITRHGDSLSIRRCWSDPRKEHAAL